MMYCGAKEEWVRDNECVMVAGGGCASRSRLGQPLRSPCATHLHARVLHRLVAAVVVLRRRLQPAHWKARGVASIDSGGCKEGELRSGEWGTLVLRSGARARRHAHRHRGCAADVVRRSIAAGVGEACVRERDACARLVRHLLAVSNDCAACSTPRAPVGPHVPRTGIKCTLMMPGASMRRDVVLYCGWSEGRRGKSGACGV